MNRQSQENQISPDMKSNGTEQYKAIQDLHHHETIRYRTVQICNKTVQYGTTLKKERKKNTRRQPKYDKQRYIAVQSNTDMHHHDTIRYYAMRRYNMVQHLEANSNINT